VLLKNYGVSCFLICSNSLAATVESGQGILSAFGRLERLLHKSANSFGTARDRSLLGTPTIDLITQFGRHAHANRWIYAGRGAPALFCYLFSLTFHAYLLS
jgi:hypothetical protein